MDRVLLGRVGSVTVTEVPRPAGRGVGGGFGEGDGQRCGGSRSDGDVSGFTLGVRSGGGGGDQRSGNLCIGGYWLKCSSKENTPVMPRRIMTANVVAST